MSFINGQVSAVGLSSSRQRGGLRTLPPVVVQSVQLTHLAGPVTPNVPVRTGVPFPKGALTSLANLQLADPGTGEQRTAQFDPLTTWEDGSHKHVLVQFLADVGASPTTHALRYGENVSRDPATGVSVSQAGGNTTVSHPQGITVVIDARGGITSVSRAGETILTNGNVIMVEAAGGASPREFSTQYATDAVVTVEESGPVTACIRIRGTFRSSAKAPYIQYVIRWFISQYTIDADCTAVDETSTANENNGIPLVLSHASRKFAFRCTYAVDGTAQYRFGLEAAGMAAGNVSGEHYLAQTGDWPWVLGSGQPAPGHTFAYSGVATGQMAPGFVNLQGSTGNKRFCVFFKDFWQKYPGELNINGTTLEVQFFSRRGVTTWDTSVTAQKTFDGNGKYFRPNSLYMRSSGFAYTERMRISFHPTARTDAQLHDENTLFQRDTLECRAPLTWYQNSKAHGDLTTLNADATTGQIAWYKQSNIALHYNMAPTQGGGQSGASTSSGNMTVYGWRDYGDRARVDSDAPYFQQDTHIGSYMDFQLFLMTGEEMFWRKAFIATQHYQDNDIRHNPHIPYASYGAPSNSNAPAGGTRYAGHTVLDHEGDHDFSEHYHISGMPELYMLTGDRRSLDVLRETTNWNVYITQYTHKLPFVLGDKYREADRYFGYPLLGMLQANRALMDRTVHARAAGCVEYFLQWMKTDSPHFGYNPDTNTMVYGNSTNAYQWPTGTPININRWSEGTGFFATQSADNSYGGDTTGTSPWFTMPCLEAIAEYREQELAWVAAGYPTTCVMADVEMMLFQALSYVIKYCWDEATQEFTYSEEARPLTGFTTPGDGAGNVHNTLGANVMLYIDKLYKDRLAEGAPQANAAWFGTTLGSKLPQLNQFFANMMRNTSATTNRQPYSAYGYEKPFNSYWKRAKDMGYMPA